MIAKFTLKELEECNLTLEELKEHVVELFNDYQDLGRICAEQGRELDGLKEKIKNGTLVELPCKAGDTVWVVYQDVETFEECIKESMAIEFAVMPGYTGICVPEIYGRYQEVYVTREQAEARLAELTRLAELKGEK